VVIDVPGPRVSALDIGDASQQLVGGRTIVSIAVANSGNVRIHPAGHLIVIDEAGVEVASADVKMGTVFPGTTTSAQGTLARQLPPGRYHVAASLSDNALALSAQRDALEMEVTGRERSIGANPTTTTTTPHWGSKQGSGATAAHTGSSAAPNPGEGAFSLDPILGLIGGLLAGAVLVGVSASRRNSRSDDR
jgi:hypothetical protein